MSIVASRADSDVTTRPATDVAKITSSDENERCDRYGSHLIGEAKCRQEMDGPLFIVTVATTATEIRNVHPPFHSEWGDTDMTTLMESGLNGSLFQLRLALTRQSA